MKHFRITILLISSIYLCISSCKKNVDDKQIKVTTIPNNPNASFQGCTQTTGTIDSGIFGLHIHGESQSHPSVLSAIDDLGLEWVYNGMYWPTIEPSKDNYNINAYDNFMMHMYSKNVNVIMSIGNYWPTWINTSDELRLEIYQMAKKCVARYKPGGTFAQENGLGNYGIRYWELINEPNLPCCGWGYHGANQPVNSALYAELLEAMHLAIREEDPNAVIILGGLSSSTQHRGPLDFLDDIYTYGAINAFDVIAYHPYGEHDNISIPLNNIEQKMNEYNDDKPIWILEIGEPNLDWGHPTKPHQVEVFNSVAGQSGQLQAFFWLGLVDLPINQTWGILDGNFNRRQPIYDSIKSYLD